MPLTMIPTTPLFPHQKKIWNLGFSGRQLEDETYQKINFFCLEWHRRSGKDIFSLQFLLGKAYEEAGNYFYVFPLKNQARLAIFEGIDKTGKKIMDYIPRNLIKKIDKNEMKIFIMTADGKESTLQFLGADANSKVGANFKGGVFSEYAIYSRPDIWAYFEPMIHFNDGWVIFNSTPRGKNHFTQLHDTFTKLNNDGMPYYSETLTIEDTTDLFGDPLMSTEEFDEKMSHGLIPKETLLQEYYCSREAPSAGGWYKDQIHALERMKDPVKLEWIAQKSDHRFTLDRTEPLFVSFDIGGATKKSDYMAIWIGQRKGHEFSLFYSYGQTGELVSHYIDKIKQFRSINNMVSPTYLFLPHDAKRKDSISGRSMFNHVKETYPELRLIGIPKTNDVISDIHFVRKNFYFFNFTNGAKDGFEKLKFYSKKLNKSTGRYSDEIPEHDYFSHWADAFRYFVIGCDLLLKKEYFQHNQNIVYSGY